MSKLIHSGDDGSGDGDNSDLAPMDKDQLQIEFASALRITKGGLLRAAAIWRIFQERGYDLSELRQGIAGVVSQIASGLLTPEAVIKFLGMATHLNAIRHFSPPEQIELVHGRLLEVVDPVQPEIVVEKPFDKLTAAEVRAVVKNGCLQDRTAQRLAISSAPPVDVKPAKRPRVDLARGELKPPADKPDEWVRPDARLTPDQHKRLAESARRSGKPEWLLVWVALRDAGLI